MRLIRLETVRHQLQVGVPLPVNVRCADGTLLLARGQVLTSEEQMRALFERGMLVDIAELDFPRQHIHDAPSSELPKLWTQALARVQATLEDLPESGLEPVLDEVARPLVALVQRDPDLAIFQVLQQHGNRHVQYGVNHATHCAIAALLTARRLGWHASSSQRAFKAALTMNVSIFELQGQLATQATPLTAKQRATIHAHPAQSMQMLGLAGISDAEWLEAVAQHHETGDGGYPTGLAIASGLATLLHQCDVYTAKLSPRQSREALAADVAARGLFAAHKDSPSAAALLKEFGLYPPGCYVRLVSGETGVVIRRGTGAHTPIVAAMTTSGGVARQSPLHRDSSLPEFGIVSALARRRVPEGLFEVLSAAICA
jgi:HD-GYP domain-containing protein (c-di-GMP phosphodiesterase class II)